MHACEHVVVFLTHTWKEKKRNDIAHLRFCKWFFHFCKEEEKWYYTLMSPLMQPWRSLKNLSFRAYLFWVFCPKTILFVLLFPMLLLLANGICYLTKCDPQSSFTKIYNFQYCQITNWFFSCMHSQKLAIISSTKQFVCFTIDFDHNNNPPPKKKKKKLKN